MNDFKALSNAWPRVKCSLNVTSSLSLNHTYIQTISSVSSTFKTHSESNLSSLLPHQQPSSGALPSHRATCNSDLTQFLGSLLVTLLPGPLNPALQLW